MRVLIDVGHPAQVHLFSNLVRDLRDRGDEVLVTARDKEVSVRLLEHYGMPYRLIPWYSGSNIIRKLAAVIPQDLTMLRILREFSPDVTLAAGSLNLTHTARLRGVPLIMLCDTDLALERFGSQYRMFADHILTPDMMAIDAGPKQVRYAGTHELGYLHPDRFTPDPSTLKRYGLSPDDTYFFVRLVAHGAWHDNLENNFTRDEWFTIIEHLAGKGRVLLSAEGDLPPGIEPFRTRFNPEDALDLMAFSTIHAGEGGSMASESAIMGVPTIFKNIHVFVIDEEVEAGIMYMPPTVVDAIALIDSILEGDVDHRQRARDYISSKVDVTTYLLDFIKEHYG